MALYTGPATGSSIRAKYAIAYTRRLGLSTGIIARTRIYTGYRGLARVCALEAERWWTRLIALSRHYRCSSRINDSENDSLCAAPRRACRSTDLDSAGLHVALYQVVCVRSGAIEPELMKQSWFSAHLPRDSRAIYV